MEDSPADQAFAEEWKRLTDDLLRAQIAELAEGLAFTEACAAVVLKVRRFSEAQLEALDPRLGPSLALSRKAPPPYPDDVLIAIALVRQWLPGRFPEVEGLLSIAQVEAIAREAALIESAFWGAIAD